MTNGTFNQNVMFSGKIGGYRRVFEGNVSLLTGGYNWNIAELPTFGNVLPAGTPVFVDDVKRTIQALYGFKVKSTSGTKLIVLCEPGCGVRARVGMTIKGQKVTAVEKTNESGVECETLTMAASVTASANEVVFGYFGTTDITTKVNGLTPYDICLDPNASSADGDVAWTSDREVLETRMPPITDAVKKALNTNECMFRFSKRP